jgi:hypothetical protein
MTNKCVPALALLMSISSLTPNTARAADKAFCRKYAKEAVGSAKRIYNAPCSHLLSSPVWSLDIEAHYNWCLGATVEEANAQAYSRLMRVSTCR